MGKEYVCAVFVREEWNSARKKLVAVCNEDWGMYMEPVLQEILGVRLSDQSEIEKALKTIHDEDEYHGDGFDVYVESYVLNEVL